MYSRYGMEPLQHMRRSELDTLHGVYVRFGCLGLGESTWYEQQIALQDVISKIVNESTSNAASRITCISLKAV